MLGIYGLIFGGALPTMVVRAVTVSYVSLSNQAVHRDVGGLALARRLRTVSTLVPPRRFSSH